MRKSFSSRFRAKTFEYCEDDGEEVFRLDALRDVCVME
jgi:hypothetical protein